VFIESATVIKQTMFIRKPAFIISVVFMLLWPKTMAFGAVATGRAKA